MPSENACVEQVYCTLQCIKSAKEAMDRHRKVEVFSKGALQQHILRKGGSLSNPLSDRLAECTDESLLAFSLLLQDLQLTELAQPPTTRFSDSNSSDISRDSVAAQDINSGLLSVFFETRRASNNGDRKR
ncbi:hypothetical protein Mapa_014821 [Marchantia paleacea]|nr:hypothetical protein Mapa_014821 [Marchantia paleacea]